MTESTKEPSGPSGEAPSFEENLARLERIVRQLESGDMSLEESLRMFEEGVGLTRVLDARLADAETKVERLLRTTETDDPSTATDRDEGS